MISEHHWTDYTDLIEGEPDSPKVKTSDEIRTERLRVPQFSHNLIIATPWPKKGENLGSLARTADALGACMAVPRDAHATQALRRGNTIGEDKVCIHWIEPDFQTWLLSSSVQAHLTVAVELARGAIPLNELQASIRPVVIVLGHETLGIPQEALDYADVIVEIPMAGVGNSLNVAVAGSLVAYKWKGWS